MPTPPNPESTHPALSSIVAQQAICSYLSNELRLRLEERVLDQARSVLMQGLLEQAAADLNFSGPVSHRSVKLTRIPVMHTFGTEFTVRVIDERPVLISYVLRNDQPVPMHVKTVNDLGKLLSIQARCGVPADPVDIPQDQVQNDLPRLVSFTRLCEVLHAVAWATDEACGCVLVSMDDNNLSALRAELQHWMSAEQHATPEHVLARVAHNQAA